MTHYEERLEQDLGRIRGDTARIAQAVQHALNESAYALLEGDAERAYSVILGDLSINRAVRASDRTCHALLLAICQAPVTCDSSRRPYD